MPTLAGNVYRVPGSEARSLTISEGIMANRKMGKSDAIDESLDLMRDDPMDNYPGNPIVTMDAWEDDYTYEDDLPWCGYPDRSVVGFD